MQFSCVSLWPGILMRNGDRPILCPPNGPKSLSRKVLWMLRVNCQPGTVEGDWVLIVISSIYMMCFPFKAFLLLLFPLSLISPGEAS